MVRYVAGAVALLVALTGCTLGVDAPGIKTTSPHDYLDRICPALADAADAGAQGNTDVWTARIDTAVEASNEFLDDYPGSDDASTLVQFSELMRDLPPNGLQGEELADAQTLMTSAGDICGTEP